MKIQPPSKLELALLAGFIPIIYQGVNSFTHQESQTAIISEPVSQDKPIKISRTIEPEYDLTPVRQNKQSTIKAYFSIKDDLTNYYNGIAVYKNGKIAAVTTTHETILKTVPNDKIKDATDLIRPNGSYKQSLSYLIEKLTTI